MRDNEDASRFEAWIADDLAGVAEYRRTEGLVVYPHTVVKADFEGRGVGSALARAALDDARARDLRVQVPCPFLTSWLARHPEYQDLTEPTP